MKGRLLAVMSVRWSSPWQELENFLFACKPWEPISANRQRQWYPKNIWILKGQNEQSDDNFCGNREGRERKNETNKQNNNNSLDSLVGLFQAGHEDVWWWLLGSWQPPRELSQRVTEAPGFSQPQKGLPQSHFLCLLWSQRLGFESFHQSCGFLVAHQYTLGETLPSFQASLSITASRSMAPLHSHLN